VSSSGARLLHFGQRKGAWLVFPREKIRVSGAIETDTRRVKIANNTTAGGSPCRFTPYGRGRGWGAAQAGVKWEMSEQGEKGTMKKGGHLPRRRFELGKIKVEVLDRTILSARQFTLRGKEKARSECPGIWKIFLHFRKEREVTMGEAIKRGKGRAELYRGKSSVFPVSNS